MTEFKSEINVPGDYDTLNEASDAILVCRTEYPLGESEKAKLARFCGVDDECIIENADGS